MADRQLIKTFKEERRKRRVRKKVTGSPARPRMCVFRSLRNISVQIIDDVSGMTLVSCSSIDKDMVDQVKAAKKKSDLSTIVGAGLAKKALAKGIEAVVFDRNRYQYHGRVKAVAEGARKAGLKF
jgi:large subunit ribosomal protein L18